MMLERWGQSRLLPVFFFILLMVILFWDFLSGSNVLMTTDAAISSASTPTADVIRTTYAAWISGGFLGQPGGSGNIQIARFLQALMSPVLCNNLTYGLACLVASIIFLSGLGKQLNRWALVCGALAAFWVGNNFTLLYAGHYNKPFVVLFFVCAILCAGATTWRGAVIWGGFIGLMFAQQPDVAFLFALFAGTHLVFRLWSRHGLKPLRWLPVLIPAAVVAFLFAAGPLLSGYKFNVKDTVQVQTENPTEKWDYITQWSWPPEESIAFIAPGYTGWRSGEPEGPYYGRMGRSAEWEQRRQGFMNFQLDSLYLGFIPLAFALFALFSAGTSPHRKEIYFWSMAAFVALLLSFGKFFPLYAILYNFPIVSNIRAPVKFIQVFQVAIGVLAAFGIDKLIFAKPDSGKKINTPQATDTVTRWFFRGSIVTAVGLLIWVLGLSSNHADAVVSFSKLGWPEDAARVIVDNQIRSLWHACIMAMIMTSVFAAFNFGRADKLRAKGVLIAGGLAIIIATDAFLLSRHYVQEMPRSYIESNDLTRFLKNNLGTQRVALLTQQGLYNVWLTYLLPYNQILTFNVSQMPRLSAEYKKLFDAGSKDPLRLWRWSSVKYLLGPTNFERQLPAGQVKKVFSYDLMATTKSEFQVVPSPRGSHAVFELLDTVPRYVLISGAITLSDDQALVRLADPRQPLMGQQGVTGSVDVISYSPGKVSLKTEANMPTVLRVAERWDPDWTVRVDGRKAEVKRFDFLCQGVELPSGAHEVTLAYKPSKLFFYMQVGGCLVLLIAGMTLLSKRYRHSITDRVN